MMTMFWNSGFWNIPGHLPNVRSRRILGNGFGISIPSASYAFLQAINLYVVQICLTSSLCLFLCLCFCLFRLDPISAMPCGQHTPSGNNQQCLYALRRLQRMRTLCPTESLPIHPQLIQTLRLRLLLIPVPVPLPFLLLLRIRNRRRCMHPNER